MQQSYERLIQNNARWVEEKLQLDPDYFKRLSLKQTPDFLWVGCSDSRVPANEITGTDPGEIFVHRNIANMVVHTDFNFLSVLQYAVEVLHVKHIIVCGHYGCGGVRAAMGHNNSGLVNKWLRNIKEVYEKHHVALEGIVDEEARVNRLVELNVIEQVRNLAKTTIVQKAWKDRTLQIHGWVYGLDSGRIRDLQVMMHEIEDLEPIFRYDDL
ncbi:MAG: carbonate dehydratase [Sphingobacteriaceae bacterium]|nr:carbonate dehydratase [Sphingobacteriaceae bacterium]